VFTDSGKQEVRDQKVAQDLTNVDLKNRVFVRLVAKDRKFIRVNFSYCTFDACYLRDCAFDSCTFVGCRFVGSNFHGSKFSGCRFDYATFERTEIDSNILVSEYPAHENLKLRFARTLRMNFQQLGDASAVNKAISLELKATAVHLEKACFSTESYYRNKYKGWDRVRYFFEYGGFKVSNFISGHAESWPKLIRTVVLVLGLIGFSDALFFHDRYSVHAYIDGMLKAVPIFMGTMQAGYPAWYQSAILAVRLVLFAFFTAIIIKRVSRR
jgi:hypothetical protein